MPEKSKAKPAAKARAKTGTKGGAKPKAEVSANTQVRVEDLRAEERFPERIPVALLVQSEDGEIEHGGTTIDISIFGLQVETHGKLETGQLVTVPKFGDCVVVWVRTLGPGKPCQAGLKMVK